ncbi:ricin B lectin domain-containing protein [Mycena amicta]|nr:ricin B lectin domain-containing protein [Mycena amicta]
MRLVNCPALTSPSPPFFPNGNTTFTGPASPLVSIISTFSGEKCLDVTNGVQQNGVRVQAWTCNSANPNQQWKNVGDGSLEWAGTGKCLDLTNGNTQQGTPIQIWDCSPGNLNQQWFI